MGSGRVAGPAVREEGSKGSVARCGSKECRAVMKGLHATENTKVQIVLRQGVQTKRAVHFRFSSHPSRSVLLLRASTEVVRDPTKLVCLFKLVSPHPAGRNRISAK